MESPSNQKLVADSYIARGCGPLRIADCVLVTLNVNADAVCEIPQL